MYTKEIIGERPLLLQFSFGKKVFTLMHLSVAIPSVDPEETLGICMTTFTKTPP